MCVIGPLARKLHLLGSCVNTNKVYSIYIEGEYLREKIRGISRNLAQSTLLREKC